MSQIREREADQEDLLSMNEEFPEYYPDVDSEEVDEPVERRGRKALLVKWSWCISLDTDNMTTLRSYDIKDDLIYEQATVQRLQEPVDGGADFKLHFFPKDYVVEHQDLTTAGNKMTDAEIKALGIVVTQKRELLRQAALEISKQDDLESSQKVINRFTKRMTRGYFHAHQPAEQLHLAMKAHVPAPCQRRHPKRAKIDLPEKMDIVGKALVEMRSHKDVAKEHGISAARVTAFVHQVKKKRLVIEELLQK